MKIHLVANPFSKLTAALLAAATFAALPGCFLFSSPSFPEAAAAPYQGPPLAIDRAGESPVIVLQAPSGGYTLTIDRVTERPGSHDVFATIRTPDPRFVHTQAIVEHRAIVPLPPAAAFRLCARIVPAGDTPEDDLYPVAIPVDPSTPPPPGTTTK